MDSNFITAVCAADLRRMQISHTTPQKPGHFCGMPQSAPRHTIQHHAALVPQLLWQIPHKEIGASYPVA
jgi:hypothetical protein